MLSILDAGPVSGATSMIDWLVMAAIAIALGLVIYFSYFAKP